MTLNVLRPATEATIRPVFPIPGPFINVATLHYKSLSANSATDTLTIRPPQGQRWVCIYGHGRIMSIAGQNASTYTELRIELTDGVNTGTVKAATFNAGSTFVRNDDVVSFGSNSDGELLLTNDRYMQITFQNTSPHTNTGEVMVLTRPI